MWLGAHSWSAYIKTPLYIRQSVCLCVHPSSFHSVMYSSIYHLTTWKILYIKEWGITIKIMTLRARPQPKEQERRHKIMLLYIYIYTYIGPIDKMYDSVYKFWNDGWIVMFKVSKQPCQSAQNDTIICKGSHCLLVAKNGTKIQLNYCR